MQSRFETNTDNGMFFFETMLTIDGMIQHKNLHLKRVQKTIDFLGHADIVDDVPLEEWFATNLQKLTPGRGIKRLRIDFIFDGNVFRSRAKHSELPLYPDIFNLAFDERAQRHSKDPFWRYKFAGWQRNLFFLENLPDGIDDVIFTNEKDEVCETTRANIYLQADDKLITPPLESGVLDGIYRSHLLGIGEVTIANQKFKVEEGIIKKSSIKRTSNIFISNGLMGLRHTRLV